MNQKELSSEREQHFYAAVAKYYFHHPEFGIVTVEDPIRINAAQRYGLTPLILYGLTVAGLPIRWMTFTPLDQPRSFRDVLLEAWSVAEGLRGRPDILRISRHLAMASPELGRDLEQIQVRVEIADSREKSLPASLRTAQNACRWMLGEHDRKERSLAGSVQTLCRDAQYDHEFHIRRGFRGVNRRETAHRIQQWLVLPVRNPEFKLTGGMDWKPGPWLWSWEASLPPDQPRSFSYNEFDDRTWLLTGEEKPEVEAEYKDFWAVSGYDDADEIARCLVESWPNPPAEIAGSAGITLQKLRWFTSGKAALDSPARSNLEDLLGIKYVEVMGGYAGTGPYTLVAKKAKDLQEVYENISGGGDACPCELVPRKGAADPSWRYVLINTYGVPPSIVMMPRGERITERLPDLLMNYEGIRSVPSKLYRDVVSTCARACREPAANIREMKAFAERYKAYWSAGSWQPGESGE